MAWCMVSKVDKPKRATSWLSRGVDQPMCQQKTEKTQHNITGNWIELNFSPVSSVYRCNFVSSQ